MEVSRIPIPALELILQYLSSDKSYFLFRQICHSWNEQFLSCCKLVLRCTFVQSIKQIKFCIDSSRSLVPETVHNSNFNFEQLEKSLLVYCLNQVDLVIECNMRISGSPLEDELIELLKSLSKALRKRVDLRVRFKNASFRSILAAVTYEFSHHWNLQLTYLSIGLVNMDQSNLGLLHCFGSIMENLTSGTHLRHFDVSTDWFDAISAYENFPEAFSGWSTKVTFTSLVILSQKKRVGSHNSQSLMKLYSEMFPSLEGMQITLNRGDIDLQLLNHFSRLSTLELTVTCSSDVEISRVFTRFVLPSICSTVKKFTFTLDFSFEMQKEMPQWKILSSFTNLVNLSLKCTTSLSVLDSIGFGELTPKLIKLSLDLSFWQHFGDNLSEIQNKANAFEMNNFQSIVEFFNCSVALKCAIISSKGTIGHYTYPLIEKVLKQPYIDSFDGQLNFAQVENLEVNTVPYIFKQIVSNVQQSNVKLVVLHCDTDGKLNNLSGVLKELSNDPDLELIGAINFHFTINFIPRNRQMLAVTLSWNKYGRQSKIVRMFIKL